MNSAWIRDTGLMAALVSLYFAYKGFALGFPLCAALLLAVLFAPTLIKPLAFAWLQLSRLLGAVMPRVFFGAVFFAIITPIGLFRRAFVGDERDRTRNTTKQSAFVPGAGRITAAELAQPY